VDGADDVDDELWAGVGSNRCGVGNRGRCRGSAGTQEMAPAENEDEEENERAGGEPPARRREGVQHVVKLDNNDVTSVCPKSVEIAPVMG
jgi:hypothetical protein